MARESFLSRVIAEFGRALGFADLKLDAAERWGLILVLLLLTFGILGRILLPVMSWFIDLILLLVGV